MDDWDLDSPPQKKAGAPEGRPADASAPIWEPGGSPQGAIQPPTASDAPPPALDGRPASAQSPVAAPRRRTKRGLTASIAAGLILLLVGVLLGFYIARSQMNEDAAALAAAQRELGVLQLALSQSEERNWNYYRAKEALTEQLKAIQAEGASSTSTTTPPFGAGKTYSDGVYLVGEAISPGTYDGVVTGEVGYWARLKATDGTVSAIIANALPRGPFVLTIVESDRAIELRGVVITGR